MCFNDALSVVAKQEMTNVTTKPVVTAQTLRKIILLVNTRWTWPTFFNNLASALSFHMSHDKMFWNNYSQIFLICIQFGHYKCMRPFHYPTWFHGIVLCLSLSSYNYISLSYINVYVHDQDTRTILPFLKYS
jgi:hypothetical protein